MPIINKGTSFSNGEQLTAKKINDMVDLARFDQSATDSASTTVNSVSQIVVADGGITSAKLATNAVETANILNANVTLPKIAAQADQTVIANVSGGAASPTAVSIVGASGILIDDDALGTDDTKGATQGNIKAYVDASSTDGFTPTASASDTKSVTLPNGLIMKFGRVSASASGTTAVNFSAFGGNFNNVFSVVLTNEFSSASSSNPVRLNAQPAASGFVIRNLLASTTNVNFVAIGR